jgi:hypothetical protein
MIAVLKTEFPIKVFCEAMNFARRTFYDIRPEKPGDKELLTYNLFLLFKIDFLRTTEYRQQIKTFRLKYIFLAGKIIKTARSVVMKLSEKYPYREIYEHSLSG